MYLISQRVVVGFFCLLGCVAQCSLSSGQVRTAVSEVWSGELETGGATALAAPAFDREHVATAVSFVEMFSGTGARVWRKPLVRFQPRGLLFAGDYLIVAEMGLYALDVRNGERVWTYDDGHNYASVRPIRMGTLVIAATGNDVVAVDAATGAVVWHYYIPPYEHGTKRVEGLVQDGTSLYVAGVILSEDRYAASGFLDAFTVKSHKRMWSISEPISVGVRRGFTDAPLVLGDKLFIADVLSNRVCAFEKLSGSVAWSFSGITGSVGMSGTPVVYKERLYVGSGDQHIYVLNPRTGKIVHQTSTKASVVAVAPCDAGVAFSDGQIHVINDDWRVTSPTLRHDSSPIVSQIAAWSGGILFVDRTTLHFVRCA